MPAARQHASRARRAVASADPPTRVGLAEQRRVLDAFLAALARDDLAALVSVLHPDAGVIGNGGGKERTARRPIRGATKVARFFLGLQQRYGPERLDAARLVLVNGDLGMVIPPWPGDAEHPPLAGRVSCFAIRDGQVGAIYDIVNPDSSAISVSAQLFGHRYGRLTPPLPHAYRQVLDASGVSRCKPGTVAPL